MAKIYTTNLTVNLDDLDRDDLKDYMQNRLYPEDVFTESDLELWATGHGFVKSQD